MSELPEMSLLKRILLLKDAHWDLPKRFSEEDNISFLILVKNELIES